MTESLRDLLPIFGRFVPLLLVLALAGLGLFGSDALLRRRAKRKGVEFPFASQMVMLAITAVAIVAIVLALPVSEATRGQLLSLLGIALTGMIAFSSTTFVANAMGGFMLRAVGNFRPGDWVRVGEVFGRVTERGLFHTELQTEDRDLTTLPNLYLVTNPVVVVRESGTIVSVQLSLGYDLHHSDIEDRLADAARAADLDDPFVQIIELGDFSVTYRVAGFLTEVKQLLTARSRLRQKVLDTLHESGIEIVSPTFMNQRRVDDARMVPAPRAAAAPVVAGPAPEDLIFDKAEEMATQEDLLGERARLAQEAEALEESLKKGETPGAEAEIARRRARMDRIAAILAQKQAAEAESS